MLLPVVGIALALLLGAALLVRPVYAATPAFIECPANGVGPVNQLTTTVAALSDMTTFDVIVISVTNGTECLFTLTEPAAALDSGPDGLPVITRDVLIRAVGGRAVIERDANAPEFRLMESNANLTLENITLRNGLAKESRDLTPFGGGAIYAHKALTLTNVVISGNVSYRGGAIYTEGPLVLDQVIADHNQTKSAITSDGGAIYVTGALAATNITMTHNTGRDCACGTEMSRGGAIFVTGTAVIANALFQDNRTTFFSGGALYVTSDLTLTSSTFISNSAGGQGGGIFAAGPLKLSNSGFISNSANSDGGGLFANGPASISQSRYLSNVVGGTGGGLASGGTHDVMVQGNTFISNQGFAGGGASVQDGIVQNNLFENNIATFPGSIFGGGGLIVFLQATVQNNRFIHNSASIGGGLHILFYPPTGSDPSRFINNVFVDNTATEANGAAIAAGLSLEGFRGGFVEISHNTIVRRTRDNSSALYIFKSSADIDNNIITQHRVGVQTSDAAVIGNGNLFDGTSTSYIGITSGAKDLTAHALFVDAAHDDYHLQPASPARDSGLDLAVETDFDGVSRPQGKGFDRGAFEFINRAPVAQTESYTTPVDTPLVVAAPGLLANDSDPDGDVVTVTVTAPPLHGVLSLNTNGAFIYTPTAAFSGTDSFTYRANDAAKFSGATVVPIHVTGDETTQSVEIAGLKATNSGSVEVGRAVNFVASVEAGNNIHFVWDFGDGTTAQGAPVSHVYAQPGDYNVTLTASNSLGVKEATTKVTIQPAQQGQLHMSLPLLAK